MERGDISNKPSPAIVINSDLLVEAKKKFFGLRYEVKFNLSTRDYLERYFWNGDLTVYILCTGEHADLRVEIENLLGTFMVPYTGLVSLKEADDITSFLAPRHIIGYFHKGETPISFRTNQRKYYQVLNFDDINYYLDGGLRK